MNSSASSIDNALVEISYEEHVKNVELAAIHLRDARNILYSIPELNDNRALSKAAILLAAAALESNLNYLSRLALRFAETRPKLFSRPHLEFLSGTEDAIDENGRPVQKSRHQALIERIQLVPTLLARAVGRRYVLPKRSAPGRKLLRTIERRDAIVHPKWDRYLASVGWWEAAEAVDAVELYLDTVDKCIHPYVLAYRPMLWTIKGPTKHDVGIGHRTLGRRGPNRRITKMQEFSVSEILLNEWMDSMLMTMLAFGHGCEEDSDGSMLTRAAMVLLYAMVDAQLAVVAQWRMHENPARFSYAELRFLNEVAVGVGHDGEVWVDSEQHPFKKRIKAIPAVLARCVAQKEYSLDICQRYV
jgi:hypothetical protein